MDATFRIFRGNSQGGGYQEFLVPVEEGMVVLDAVHRIQEHQANDLAVRWNCKAGKCGSCGAEVNGKPRLMCMTRMDQLPLEEPVTIHPVRTFPVIRDLVCDVSWNYEVNKRVPPFTPGEGDLWRWQQKDIERPREFRKCIECFLCQTVCHVLRTHDQKSSFIGPRFLVRAAGLDMHPMDSISRTRFLKEEGGIGLCNITKCCTEVCPEDIHITDDAIIPMKERVADDFYDPVRWLLRKITRRG
ncbi:MAG: succinate dehydrogenase/fumarate reductase iron-sulfur subunit [Dehalococcoidia bacterium]|nr:succinate dehydrogenase/fumarate reductase iron-sulfur subunit [Dehalococcoidia bacterium]